MDLAQQIKDQKTILLPIDSLKPYPKNARTHSKSQIEKLAHIISKHGFLGSILINNEDERRIIAGHGRQQAAKLLGLTELPCSIAGHLNEEQIRAHTLADNQITLDAGWDMGTLKEELQWLDNTGYDMTLTGFDEDTLKDLLADAETAQLLGDPDDVPTNAPTRC